MMNVFDQAVKDLVRFYPPYKSAATLEMAFTDACINWSSVGSVSIEFARAFANRLLEVCDEAEKVKFEFEAGRVK